MDEGEHKIWQRFYVATVLCGNGFISQQLYDQPYKGNMHPVMV